MAEKKWSIMNGTEISWENKHMDNARSKKRTRKT